MLRPMVWALAILAPQIVLMGGVFVVAAWRPERPLRQPWYGASGSGSNSPTIAAVSSSSF